MKTLITFVFCLCLSLRAADIGADFALRNGDRVVFYGDSITQEGGYGRFVESYARSRFPEWDLRFFNAGVGGDTVRGGGAGDIGTRLERDVIRLQPTVVTIMLGMNDGRYRRFEPATLTAFSDGYRSLLIKLKEALPKTRFYLVLPSSFDDFSRSPDFNPGYDSVLRKLGEAVTQIAREQGAKVVDFGTCLEYGIGKVARENPELARQILPDRVHPSPAAHYLMGATLLKAWHAPALVARVEIDARTRSVVKSTNSSVSALTFEEGHVAWNQLDGALPLPLNFSDADVELTQKMGADLDALDFAPLVVTGLANGRYEVRIDDQSIGAFTSNELAGGINLAKLNTPMRWQAFQVRWGAENGHETQRVERHLYATQSSDSNHKLAADILSAIEESEQAVRSRPAIPKQHRFTIVQVQ